MFYLNGSGNIKFQYLNFIPDNENNSFATLSQYAEVHITSDFYIQSFKPDKIRTNLQGNQQPRTKNITGIVLDENNQPLIGVSVIVKGTMIGTITDVKGSFSLEIPFDAQTLVFTYIGMQSQEVDIGDKTTFNITMSEESFDIEEVVVVGYGVQRKESVVGAISQANGEQIRQNVQGGDLATGLIGSVPGMITLRTTGRPGGGHFGTPSSVGQHDQPVVMYIRGVKTWNEAAPLVLVDGVERDLNHVNPYEIENISILKDASATAVFGVKGANGVILLTTSRGKEGKPRLTFNYTTTAKTLSRVAEKANAYIGNLERNYALYNEVAINEESWNYIKPQAWVEYYRTQEYPDYFPDVNWYKELMKDFAIDHSANLTLSGGTKFVKYFSSVAYLAENDQFNTRKFNGWTNESNFRRINLRSNLDFQITSTTTLSANLSGYYFNQQSQGGGLYHWRGLWRMSPDVYPVTYRDGNWGENATLHTMINPVFGFATAATDLNKRTQINTDFILTQKLDFITKGLSAKVKLSYDNINRIIGPHVGGSDSFSKYISPLIVDDPKFRPNMKDPELAALEEKYTTWNMPGAGTDGFDWTLIERSRGTESADLNVYRNLLYELSLNYNQDFGKHNVGAMALVSRQIKASGSMFPSYREDWVGRITYAFNKKYLFEANAAYNGSEKFDRKYRFGFFPSVAVGWIVSNEAFFDPIKPYLNNLKFRFSDGVVGSDAGIARWLYTEDWIVHKLTDGPKSASYFGSPYVQKSYPYRYFGAIANPDIHWEVSRKRDFGVETGFFNNMLKFNFDYFMENRTRHVCNCF